MSLNENFQKLVTALRSGEFQQAKGTLNRLSIASDFEENRESYDDNEGTTGYCCLGVACEIAVREKVVTKKVEEAYNGETKAIFGTQLDDMVYDYDGSDSFLPRPVAAWLGLPDGQRDLFFDMTGTELDDEDVLPKHFLGLKDGYGSLIIRASELNDRFNYTFDKIADVIENGKMVHWDNLPVSFRY